MDDRYHGTIVSLWFFYDCRNSGVPFWLPQMGDPSRSRLPGTFTRRHRPRLLHRSPAKLLDRFPHDTQHILAPYNAVVDDGDGMDPDDALLCFEAHATSKISQESDLFAITTMGFRGEALPSIASVSKITLRTRRKDQPEGCEVVIHGGKMISDQPAGCAPGTEIIVYHDVTPGKYWKSWSSSVTLKSNTVICRFTMPSENVTITAETVATQRSYTLDLTEVTPKLHSAQDTILDTGL